MNFLKNTDRRYLKICLYAGVTAVTSVLAILFLYSSRGYFQQAWQLLMSVLRPLIIGCLLCYILYPVVEFINRRIKALCKGRWERIARHSRTLAIILTLALIIALIVLFLIVIITTMTRSIQHIDLAYLQSLFANTQSELYVLGNQAVDYLNAQGLPVGDIGSVATSFVAGLSKVISSTFFGIIFMIYFLADGQNISAYWKRAARKVLPARTIELCKELGADANRCFAGYIRGQSLDAVLVGVETSIVLTIIGVPYAPLIGLITGVGNLIPYVGPILGYAAIILINLMQYNPRILVFALIALSVIMVIDSNIVNPRLLANAIQVHPLLVIASLLAGGTIGGLIGMLLSVPCGAFIKMQFEKWIARE